MTKSSLDRYRNLLKKRFLAASAFFQNFHAHSRLAYSAMVARSAPRQLENLEKPSCQIPASSASFGITVGARGSRLSQAQVEEVYQEIKLFFPEIRFFPTWITTQGDKDKTTSLKTLEKTNFFTDEVDRRQVAGEFQISIHSAKDLPDPIHPELEVIAFTKGVDPSDSLVVRELPIPYGARIGTSSERREAFLKNWREDLVCVDVRGTIDERLKLLDDGHLDGVVIAEAALIRLQLTERARIHLDWETAKMQGRLAIIARKNDTYLRNIFQKVHYDDGFITDDSLSFALPQFMNDAL